MKRPLAALVAIALGASPSLAQFQGPPAPYMDNSLTGGSSGSGMTTSASNATTAALPNLIGAVYGGAYGMVCDGSGDQTAELQAAIDATAALGTTPNGGTLYLPPGICRVTGALTVTSGMKIVGAGILGSSNTGGTAIRTSSTTANVFTVTAADPVIFDSFRIDTLATKVSGAGISLAGPSPTTSNTGSIIHNMQIQAMYDGIVMSNALGFRIHENRITESVHNSLTSLASAEFPDGPGGGDMIHDNAFRNQGTTASCNANVEYQGSGHFDIHDNVMLGCDYGVLFNLQVGPTGTMKIVGNSMEDQHQAQIAITQGVTQKDFNNLIISNNELSNLAANATTLPKGSIYIGVGTPDGSAAHVRWLNNVTITGNVLNHGAVTVSGGAWFQILDGNNITISNNALHGGNVSVPWFYTGAAATNVTIDPNNTYFRDPGGKYSHAAGMNWNAINIIGPASPNLVLNPGMRLDQVSEGATTAVNSGAVYCADGWQSQSNFTNGQTATCQRDTTDAPPGGLASAKVTITAAGAANASDYMRVFQKIEAINLGQTQFGGASAQAVAMSFWAKSSITATVTGFLMNGAAANRSYLWTCDLTAATWTKCTWVIPGDTGGTWDTSTTAEGMRLQVTLASGSSLTTSQTLQWRNSAGLYGGTGQTDISATNGATIALSNVKLEISEIPSNYVAPTISALIASAQRYYIKTFPQGTAVAQSGGLAGASCAKAASTTATALAYMWRFPVEMRASPTIVTYNPSAGNANWRNVAGAADAVVAVDPSTAKGTTGVEIAEQTTALTVGNDYCIHATANSRL